MIIGITIYLIGCIITFFWIGYINDREVGFEVDIKWIFLSWITIFPCIIWHVDKIKIPEFYKPSIKEFINLFKRKK